MSEWLSPLSNQILRISHGEMIFLKKFVWKCEAVVLNYISFSRNILYLRINFLMDGCNIGGVDFG